MGGFDLAAGLVIQFFISFRCLNLRFSERQSILSKTFSQEPPGAVSWTQAHVAARWIFTPEGDTNILLSEFTADSNPTVSRKLMANAVTAFSVASSTLFFRLVYVWLASARASTPPSATAFDTCKRYRVNIPSACRLWKILPNSAATRLSKSLSFQCLIALWS